ncbi:MAG: hypothetical protein HY897_11030 [Deltaproteobacteria bacterium]|nr:hypothetical protein [Deltaproteobacteria bacterium]
MTGEKGVERNEVSLLTELVIDEVTKLKKYNVIGQKDLEKMVSWEKEKLKSCTEGSCLAEIAGAMGATFYIEGSIGLYGSQYIITTKLIDASKVEILARETKRVGKSEDLVVETIIRMVKDLFGAPTETGQPAVTRTPISAPAWITQPPATSAPARPAPPVQPTSPSSAHTPAATLKSPPPSGQQTKPIDPRPASRPPPLPTTAPTSEKVGARTETAVDEEKSHFWRYATLVAGAGCLAVGGVYTYLGLQTQADYESQKITKESAESTATQQNAFAITGYVVGGSLIVTGIVLWALESRAPAPVNVSLGVSPLHGGSVALAGRW